jgi:hypothetical protein
MLTESQLRALRLISSGHEGATEDLLRANGVSTETMVELIHAELAVLDVQRLGRPQIEVMVLRITQKGRKVLSPDSD